MKKTNGVKKMRKSLKRYLRYACAVIGFILLFSALLMLINYWEKSRDGGFTLRDGDELNESVTYEGNEFVLRNDLQTVLIMGLDKFEEYDESASYNNDKQADFLMLLVIDDKNESCTALHINRDTMSEINVLGVAGNKIGTVTKQIALAHTYGNGREVSCRNTADAVSGLLCNAEIDHYISVTMDAVAIFNDLAGGVEVTVLDDFTGVDDTLLEGETVVLKGEHALNYVRTRYGLENSSNSSRMVRQRQYLEALLEKTKECVNEDEKFIAEAVVTMSDYIVSDCTVTKLQNLSEKISEYQLSEIKSFDGKITQEDSHIAFYPDEESLEEVIINLFYRAKE